MVGLKIFADSPLQPRGVLYSEMSLTPYSSSKTTKKPKIVSCLSKHFIDTVFEYQREFMEIKHREKMNRLRAMGQNAPKENETFKHEKLVHSERIESLRKVLDICKANLRRDKDKMVDLKDITLGIVNGVLQQKSLSNELLLRCKQQSSDLGL